MKKLLIALLIVMLMLCGTTYAQHLTFTDMGVPNVNSSFKTYMGDHIMSKSAPQYKFLKKWGYVDTNGFYRCAAEKDFGVTDDYYLVALGSYYSRTIGDKFRITTDTGNVFYVVLCEFKADRHTDSKHQYTVRNKDVVEFIVKTKSLLPIVKSSGSANTYMPLNGSIAKVEKMTFNYE